MSCGRAAFGFDGGRGKREESKDGRIRWAAENGQGSGCSGRRLFARQTRKGNESGKRIEKLTRAELGFSGAIPIQERKSAPDDRQGDARELAKETADHSR